MNTLFKLSLTDLSLKIREVNSCDTDYFDFLYNNSHKFGIQFFDILSDFFNKDANVPDYFVDCQYNDIVNNYRMRFVIIDDDNDYYLVPLRIIDPVNKKTADRHFVISHNILPLNGSNTRHIYESLSKMIQTAYVVGNGKDVSNVIYFNRRNDCDFGRSKWKSKNGINILSKKIDYAVYKKVPQKVLDDIIALNAEWAKAKKRNENSANIKKICCSGIGECIVYYYGKSLIGFQYVTIGYRNIATCHLSKSIPNTDIDCLKKFLGAYMIYILHNIYFSRPDIEIINYLGVRDVKKYDSLCQFKNKYFKSKTIYYKKNILDFIKV